MKPLFNSVKLNKPKVNSFDLSHEKKLSLNMGELIPIYLQEIIPGDRFKVNSEMLVRFQPMLAPIMHRINAYVHYFFVPCRLLYDSWGDYITGGVDGLQTPVFPTIALQESIKSYFGAGSLADYMGLPTAPAGTITQPIAINALPFRAYQLIYNEFYRDQTLNTAAAITKNTTPDATEIAALLTMRNRCWEKDYFTSALPWTQRGADVMIPYSNTVNYSSLSTLKRSSGASAGAGAVTINASSQLQDGTSNALRVENISSIDTQITVNNLRKSTKLQMWLERNALGGSRYIEQILAHFGVRSSDARLQRPEYLGGGKTPIVVSEVVSTVKETTNPQGNMSGHAVGVGSNNGFTKYFEEHGYILGILSIMPRTAYQQGVHRMWSKVDRYDWYFPEFANIGEQAILNKEVYHDFTTGTPAGTFGYAPRYAEYKFNPSTVHGDFRTSLNFWHLGRIFASAPALNSAFVTSDPTNRIFAVVDSSDKCLVQIYNSVKAIRPMPVFGSPML